MALFASPAGAAPASPTAAADIQALPNSFQWSSSGQLITPKPDASHNVVAVKDPSVVYANGKWHVFMTTA
ncbi:glycoside hydrolase, partial [Streptomyces sp. 2MCAF27]